MTHQVPAAFQEEVPGRAVDEPLVLLPAVAVDAAAAAGAFRGIGADDGGAFTGGNEFGFVFLSLLCRS